MRTPTVVLAATEDASTFWPLRDGLTTTFGSRSLLQQPLQVLGSLGCRQFVVVASQSARHHIEELSRELERDVRVTVVPHAIDPAGVLKAAEPALSQLAAGDVYLADARDVVERSLHARLIDLWSNRQGAVEGLIGAAAVMSSASPGTYLTMSGERVVSAMPDMPKSESGLRSCGGLLFSASRELCETVAAEIDSGTSSAAYEDGLSRLMHWHHFRAHIYQGDWVRVANGWHLLDVMRFFFSLWAANVESPGEEFDLIEDGIWVGKGARIDPRARIQAPALIGEGSTVAAGCLIRGSIIGNGARIGEGSLVLDSYVGEEVVLASGCSVRASVLGRSSSIGRGSVILAGTQVDEQVAGRRMSRSTTLNKRLRGALIGDHSSIGEETRISAGVRICAGVTTDPGLLILHDVIGGPVFPDSSPPTPSLVASRETSTRRGRISRRIIEPR